MSDSSKNSILVSASIVLYQNDVNMLLQVIDSFLSTEPNVFLYLIDNSPTDSLRKLHTDSRIEYIHNPKNPGFGAAHNMAINKAFLLGSQYHLILNPDVYFDKGTIEKISNFMNSNLSVGLLMPKVTFPNGEIQYLCKTNPTFFDLFARGFLPTGLKEIFQKRLDRYEYRNHDYNDFIYDVPYLSGCFMFLRVDILKTVGLFDEDIFMYLEDADLTRRILKVARTVYFPYAHIYHHYAGLTHKKLRFKLITIKSAFIYFNKWGWLKNIF